MAAKTTGRDLNWAENRHQRSDIESLLERMIKKIGEETHYQK